MIRLGIIGCANVVEKHIVDALKNVKNGKLTIIASRDINKAKECAKKFGCDYASSYDDLLNSDIDAVYIPLPIALHEEWVIKAAKAKKHIICEKSLSDNLDSVKKIIEVCKKNKVILFENFMCNYHPQHSKVISLLPEIGNLFIFNGFFGFPPLNKENIRYNKDLGGGSLNDAGCYPVFMSRKILNSEPIAVNCKLVFDGVDIKGSAMMEFPDNKIALIGFGFDNLYQNNYKIWGSKGIINVERAYSIPSQLKPNISIIRDESEMKIDISPANHFTLIFNDFFNRINNKDFDNFDYSQILNQAKVMQALRVSAKEGKRVMIDTI
jgi:dTDP-3,4-didehydro-2,6-dideoxy-alpha-D-glucose 3-reductase